MKIGKSKTLSVFFPAYSFKLLICVLIFAGCNKKYYEGVAKAKDDNSLFVILKTGEKIEIKGAKMHSSRGTIISIDKLSGKDFEKKDVQVVQNNTGYYKKSFAGFESVFAERTNKGAVNIYSFTRTQSDMGGHSFINYVILEMDDSKETIISDSWPTDKEVDKMRVWFAKGPEALKILNKWANLSYRGQKKYKKEIFEEVALKYNEEMAAASKK